MTSGTRWGTRTISCVVLAGRPGSSSAIEHRRNLIFGNDIEHRSAACCGSCVALVAAAKST